LLLAGRLGAADDGVAFEKSVKPFLTKYCVSCHGPKQQKGERRFDRLTGNITDSNVLADYQDVLDLLNLGEMPPAKAPQPKEQERRTVVGWLTGTIQA
jgi:mono/diheme cytochrome c family protein